VGGFPRGYNRAMTEELTPRQIVAELDKYIIGQHAAKRAVSIALRNRYRRRMLPEEMREDVIPKNILMIGPTGVGKTEIARRLASLAHAPFVKVEATKFTEVGYVGRDVDSMVRDLVTAAIRMVEKEKMDEVGGEAESRAVDRIVDIMQPLPKTAERIAGVVGSQVGSVADALNQLFRTGNISHPAATHDSDSDKVPEETPADTEANHEVALKRKEQAERIRAKLKEQILSGARDGESIDIEVEDNAPSPILQVFGAQPGMPDDLGSDMQNALGSLMPKKRKKRTVTIAEARKILALDEARSLIDHDAVTRTAIERAEQTGIIFVDEMDKIAGRGGGQGPDVSREGVQRDILPIIEGSTVQTKHGPVRTDYVLFIAAGAFHISKPSDLIPELQGRMPIRVELENLTQEDFRRILTEPRNALIKQYIALLGTENVTLEFTEEAIAEIARVAAEANAQMENIGARRLHTIIERLLDEISFDAPADTPKSITIDGDYVRKRLDAIVKNEDLSRYIL